MSKLKHIVIDESNYEALKQLGRAGDSFNDVLTNILEGVKPYRYKREGEKT